MKKIWVAAGCFWGVEELYRRIKGVTKTRVVYANGPGNSVSYEEVCEGSGHAEAVEVTYDPKVISLRKLIDLLFLFVDPYSLNKQGNDVGVQYRSGIYYDNEADGNELAAMIAEKQAQSKRKIMVKVEPLRNAVVAENYHQEYLIKNPHGYCHVDFDVIPEEIKKPGF